MAVALALICFVGGPWAVAFLTRRTVWVINGLDIPLEVTVSGRRVPVAANGNAKTKTSVKTIEFVARTMDGREVDRAEFRPSLPGSKVAFNVLGATTLFVHEAIYVPESRKYGDVYGSGKLWEDRIVGRQMVELTNIDFFLEPPPPTVRADPDNPGRRDLRSLSVDGGWRNTLRSLAGPGEGSNQAVAFELARRVAAAQPGDAYARDMATALTPPPPKEMPPVSPPSEYYWDAVATHRLRRAWVQHRPAGNGRCLVRCDSGGREWVTGECLSKASDLRFTTEDCERLLVLRVRGEGSFQWRQAPVVFVYRRGQLETRLMTEDFMSDERLIQQVAPDRFLWMKGSARLSADRGTVEFETLDGRTQRVPLLAAAP